MTVFSYSHFILFILACDASDYNDKCVASWRTNCPDGCAITKYVKTLDAELDGHWQKVVTE